MPKKFGIDLKDPAVIEATSMVQKSFRGYVIRKKLAADGPPRFLGEGLQDVSLVDGSAAKIVGRVKGFPDPTIAWFKDGQPIKESRKFKIVFEDPDLVSLVVTNCDQQDVGTYTCKAYNQFGEAFDSAKVIIEVPAKVEKGPSNGAVKVGSTLTLTATISGDPEPEVGWAKDGKDVEEDDHLTYDIDGESTTLTITNITKKDAGKYEVYCENDKGFDHSFATITVS